MYLCHIQWNPDITSPNIMKSPFKTKCSFGPNKITVLCMGKLPDITNPVIIKKKPYNEPNFGSRGHSLPQYNEVYNLTSTSILKYCNGNFSEFYLSFVSITCRLYDSEALSPLETLCIVQFRMF